MIRAYRAADVRAAEQPLLAAGEPLMERASGALAIAVARLMGGTYGRRALVLAGPGNNGADALYAGAWLARRGMSVCAVLFGSVHEEALASAVRAGVRTALPGEPDGATAARAPDGAAGHSPAPQEQVPSRDSAPEEPAADQPAEPQEPTPAPHEQLAPHEPTSSHEPTLPSSKPTSLPHTPAAPDNVAELAAAADVWIDGLLGIGARGGLREPMAGHVRRLQALRTGQKVVAVDVPSGIGVDDGTVEGPVLTADLTVTMGAPKPGLYLEPARRHAGRIHVSDIGLRLNGEPALVSLQREDARRLARVPGPDSHKYTRGVVGIMAGSERFPGAGFMCVDAALAAGPGMVRYAGTRFLAQRMVDRHPECVLGDGRVDAWVLGPGIDVDDERAASEVARRLQLALTEQIPVVLDAGAIALAGQVECGERVVLTPHAGEIAALLTSLGEATSRAEVEAAPARAARLAATITGATVLLKGPVDITCIADGPLRVQSGPAWRATAGAGDVLAGILGTFLAQSIEPVRAASLAAYVHGLASPSGPARATDIAARIPGVLAELAS